MAASAQLLLTCGLGSTALVNVPANLATSGVPYWACLPKSSRVLGWSLPKFHTHPTLWLPRLNSGPSDQNG